jgi:hypothetical protein
MRDPDRCRCTWARIDHDDCCLDDDCRCTIHHEGDPQ